MVKNKAFDIHIFNLKDKVHEFSFPVKDEFWEEMGGEKFPNTKITADVQLDKRDNIIEALFHIHGSLELICDRSLNPFDHPIQIEERVVFKFGEEETTLDDDLFVITKNTQVINVAQLIYDFIGTAIPMKKLHPDFVEEDEEHNDWVYIDESQEDTQDDSEAVDPRWKALEKLKNSNKEQ